MFYKSLQLTAKLSTMSDNEQFKLLSTDETLVKCTLIVSENFTLMGYRKKCA